MISVNLQLSLLLCCLLLLFLLCCLKTSFFLHVLWKPVSCSIRKKNMFFSNISSRFFTFNVILGLVFDLMGENIGHWEGWWRLWQHVIVSKLVQDIVGWCVVVVATVAPVAGHARQLSWCDGAGWPWSVRNCGDNKTVLGDIAINNMSLSATLLYTLQSAVSSTNLLC